jgi:hypothetical protein
MWLDQVILTIVYYFTLVFPSFLFHQGLWWPDPNSDNKVKISRYICVLVFDKLRWNWSSFFYKRCLTVRHKHTCVNTIGQKRFTGWRWEPRIKNVTLKLGRLERMKHGNGIKGWDDRSSGIEILMTDANAKINSTDPLRLTKEVVWRYYKENKIDQFPR